MELVKLCVNYNINDVVGDLVVEGALVTNANNDITDLRLNFKRDNESVASAHYVKYDSSKNYDYNITNDKDKAAIVGYIDKVITDFNLQVTNA